MKLFKAIHLALKDVIKAYALSFPLLRDIWICLIIAIHCLVHLIVSLLGALSLVLYVVLFPLIVIRKMRLVK